MTLSVGMFSVYFLKNVCNIKDFVDHESILQQQKYIIFFAGTVGHLELDSIAKEIHFTVSQQFLSLRTDWEPRWSTAEQSNNTDSHLYLQSWNWVGVGCLPPGTASVHCLVKAVLMFIVLSHLMVEPIRRHFMII